MILELGVRRLTTARNTGSVFVTNLGDWFGQTDQLFRRI